MSDQVEVAKAATRFEIRVNGELAGYLEYSDADGVRTLPHTFVDPAFRGRGLAPVLIGQTLDATRADGLGVLPVCPAVRGFIAKNADYHELVPEDRRAEFGL